MLQCACERVKVSTWVWCQSVERKDYRRGVGGCILFVLRSHVLHIVWSDFIIQSHAQACSPSLSYTHTHTQRRIKNNKTHTHTQTPWKARFNVAITFSRKQRPCTLPIHIQQKPNMGKITAFHACFNLHLTCIGRILQPTQLWLTNLFTSNADIPSC